MSCMYESHHTRHTHEGDMSCHTHEWDTSHTWMRHVISHTWMRHVTHINETCHPHKWDISNTWMRHVTHMNETYHCRATTRVLRATTPYYVNWTVDLTFERSSYFFLAFQREEKSEIVVKIVDSRDKSAARKLEIDKLNPKQVLLVCLTWLTHICDMAHSCVLHDVFM